MKKFTSTLLCLILLMTMVLPVHADEITQAQQETIYSEQETQVTEQETIHIHSWNEADTATCVTDGMLTRTCVCGETETTESKAKGHDFEAWSITATTHSRNCKAGDAAETGDHTFQEEVVKMPTCKEDGSKKKYCTVCNYQETIVLQKLTSHTYDSACDSACNVCGKEREIEHTFTKTWSKDYNGHWHECSKCGEKDDYSKHIASSAATEEQDQVCMTCGYLIEAKKEHKHTFETQWTNDKVGHWHVCTGKNCNLEKDYASHDYDNECDADCNTCGFERENSHDYDTEGWNVSNFEHWNICRICGEESNHEKHVAGPEATDLAAQICTVCGFELKPKQEHSHDFGTHYFGKEDVHWQVCDCGELSVPEPHIWGNGIKNKNDTITFGCTLCDVEKMEAAPAGFPWLTVILAMLALLCIGGIVVLVILLKRGHFDEDDMQDEFQDNVAEQEDYLSEEELTLDADLILDEELAAEKRMYDHMPVQDPEEKAIDDFFASINRKSPK